MNSTLAIWVAGSHQGAIPQEQSGLSPVGRGKKTAGLGAPVLLTSVD